jgi:hypothetical protein
LNGPIIPLAIKSARSILTTRLRAIALGGAAVGLAQLTLLGGSAQAVTVDKMLFLSTDVSGSIDTAEYNTQRQGWSNAFLLPTIQSSIAASPNGIAVAVGQWDTIARTPLAIDWTLLTDNASVNSFAAQLATMARQGSGSTCVSCGINAAVASIQSAISSGRFDSATKIIDISSDGIENVTNDATVRAARDNAASQGININALAIEGDFGATGVTDYYNNNVITPIPPGSFVKTVTGFGEFQAAATIKLEQEINGVPGPLPVFGAMAAFGWAGRLRKRVNLAKRNLTAMA